MKSILKKPAVNAACISLFTAFYALIFIITSGHIEFERLLYYNRTPGASPFWTGWSNFLAAGHHAYIAYALIAVTILVALMLTFRRHSYDEYHIAHLLQCLAVAVVLTLMAIALFYLIILSDPQGIVEKFTLFIVVHWTTVALADLVFVFICRWR